MELVCISSLLQTMIYVIICCLLLYHPVAQGLLSIFLLKSMCDQPVCQLRVLGKKRTVKVSSDHILVNHTLIACFSIISRSIEYFSQRLAVINAGSSSMDSQNRLQAYQKITFQHNIADQTSLSLFGVKIYQVKPPAMVP